MNKLLKTDDYTGHKMKMTVENHTLLANAIAAFIKYTLIISMVMALCHQSVLAGTGGGIAKSQEQIALEAEIARRKAQYEADALIISRQTIEIEKVDKTGKLIKESVSIGNDIYKLIEKLGTGAIVSGGSGLGDLGKFNKLVKGGSNLLGSMRNVFAGIDPGFGFNKPGHSQPFWEFDFTREEMEKIKNSKGTGIVFDHECPAVSCFIPII